VILPPTARGAIGHGLVPQYETLRGGALGNPVDPSARAGLAILLCCGMWAWARTLAAGPAPRPAPAVPVAPSVLGASRELARLLADMTLASIRRSP
jgi:hypothetical protein